MGSVTMGRSAPTLPPALTSSRQPLCRLPGPPSRPGHLPPKHPPSHAACAKPLFPVGVSHPSGWWCCNLLPTPASLPAPASQQLGWVLAAPSSVLGAVSWGPLSAVHTDQTWHRKAAPSGDRAPQACGPHCSKSAYGPWKLLCVRAQLLSRVQLIMTPWTVAHQAPLSTGFSRQECWSGLPCPPPGDLPHPGIEPASFKAPALQEDSFTTKPPGKPSHPGKYSMYT